MCPQVHVCKCNTLLFSVHQTIQDLLKKAKANRPVAEDDIPPPVALGSNSRGASPINVQGKFVN